MTCRTCCVSKKCNIATFIMSIMPLMLTVCYTASVISISYGTNCPHNIISLPIWGLVHGTVTLAYLIGITVSKNQVPTIANIFMLFYLIFSIVWFGLGTHELAINWSCIDSRWYYATLFGSFILHYIIIGGYELTYLLLNG